MDTLIREWNPFGWDGLPPDLIVHHVDGNRANCEPWNLLLLDPALHVAFVARNLRCPYTGKFLSPGQWERRMGYAYGAAA